MREAKPPMRTLSELYQIILNTYNGYTDAEWSVTNRFLCNTIIKACELQVITYEEKLHLKQEFKDEFPKYNNKNLKFFYHPEGGDCFPFGAWWNMSKEEETSRDHPTIKVRREFLEHLIKKHSK